jgi:serum/glucocorticoid-regulated kinase 2
MSPEIITGIGHSFEVDYYCLGALLYELLVGCPPFYSPDFTSDETRHYIVYEKAEFPNNILISE